MEQEKRTAFGVAIERSYAWQEERLPVWLNMASPEEFLAMELEAAAMGREIADALTRDVFERVVSDAGFQAVTTAAAMKGNEVAMRRAGVKETRVTLLGGTEIRVPALYVRPRPRRRPGPKRKRGQRGKSGVGLYPALAALGIWQNVTPALGAEVARQVASSDSLPPAP